MMNRKIAVMLSALPLGAIPFGASPLPFCLSLPLPQKST